MVERFQLDTSFSMNFLPFLINFNIYIYTVKQNGETDRRVNSQLTSFYFFVLGLRK
jgi:hypothetical protein